MRLALYQQDGWDLDAANNHIWEKEVEDWQREQYYAETFQDSNPALPQPSSSYAYGSTSDAPGPSTYDAPGPSQRPDSPDLRQSGLDLLTLQEEGYRMIQAPDGKVHYINLPRPDGTIRSDNQFIQEKDPNLDSGNFSQVLQRKRTYIKGWTLPEGLEPYEV